MPFDLLSCQFFLKKEEDATIWHIICKNLLGTSHHLAPALTGIFSCARTRQTSLCSFPRDPQKSRNAVVGEPHIFSHQNTCTIKNCILLLRLQKGWCYSSTLSVATLPDISSAKYSITLPLGPEISAIEFPVEKLPQAHQVWGWSWDWQWKVQVHFKVFQSLHSWQVYLIRVVASLVYGRPKVLTLIMQYLTMNILWFSNYALALSWQYNTDIWSFAEDG